MPNLQNTFQNDVWNPWTIKSVNIPFKTSLNSIGDGEQKLGAEFNTIPLGQNFSYDLNINQEKWEVKKLDSDNSFRLGVEVSTHYTKVISTVIRIFEKIILVNDKLIEGSIKEEITEIRNSLSSTSGISTTLLIHGLRKNEVSASNLDKANSIIEKLKTFTINDDLNIDLYNSHTGTLQSYDLLKAFEKLIVEDLSRDEISDILGSADNFNILLLQREIKNDLMLFQDNSLKDTLNNIVRNIFSQEIKLVLVHEQYGFKPITNLNNIYCNRITSGNPRCKIL